MTRRQCIFCGADGPLTREHIFAVWFRDMVAIWDAKPASRTFHTPSGYREVDFEAAPLDQTAKVVCVDCNNGWMARLESDISPILGAMLQGQQRRMEVRDLELLAVWAFKTSCVVDAASLGGSGPHFPTEDRYRLREAAQLPMMSDVRMTTWPGTTTSWTHHWGMNITASYMPLSAARQHSAPLDGEATAYGATLAIGPVVFRTYATTQEPVSPKYFHDRVPGITGIWPQLEAFDWEPVFHLSANQVKEFALGIPIALEHAAGGSGEFWRGEQTAPIQGPI